MKIKGTFDVTLAPLETYATSSEGIGLNRMSIDKTFSGDLSASSQGEMLSAMTPVDGSAGYVAIEHVKGTLEGKHGSFVLQHFGTMSSGNNFLLLEVVPNSGTNELQNLSGKMSIEIKDGQHYYEFDYQL